MSLSVTLVSSAGFHLGVGHPTRETTSRGGYPIGYPTQVLGIEPPPTVFTPEYAGSMDSTWRKPRIERGWLQHISRRSPEGSLARMYFAQRRGDPSGMLTTAVTVSTTRLRAYVSIRIRMPVFGEHCPGGGGGAM